MADIETPRARVVRALQSLHVPDKAKSVYPSLHGVASRLDGIDYAEAVGLVFSVVSDACGVKYGSQYMGNVIMARHRDGTLQSLLREVAA